MQMIAEILVSAMLVVGGFFGLVGSYGLVKLPDPMTRLHGPTKATTLGVGGVIIAALIYFAAFTEDPSLHELLISLFLFLTAPITGLMIAKANIHLRNRPDELPEPGHGEVWATFSTFSRDDEVDDDARIGE